MKKLTTAEFSIQRIDHDVTNTPISRVYRYGHPTDTLIEGAHLVACVHTAGRYVVFATHNSPLAKKMSIHLLDTALQPLDGINMGFLFGQSYAFKGIRLYTHDQIGFQFLGRYQWAVQAHQESLWRIPYCADPFGTRRIQPMQWSRYLTISRTRQALIPRNQPGLGWASA